MREFNIFGPVNPQHHYHVNRVNVKQDLQARIHRGRYMTLNAARQTGKTTILRETISELEATGNYFGIALDFELLADFDKTYFYEELAWLLQRWRARNQPSVPEPTPMRHHGDFVRWLQSVTREIGKRGLLIIDEFDAVAAEIIEPILSLFRGMYLEKDEPESDALHSIILVGVRNLPSLLDGTQSPFNIADQFTVPYFSQQEVQDLLTFHTAETGQTFQQEVVDTITAQTAGQPFLVNRLGQMLTQEFVSDVKVEITARHLEKALVQLVNENNTHFSSIVSKALPHRQMLLPMLFYDETRANLLQPETAELLMFGVLRASHNLGEKPLARIANAIYRNILLSTFAPPLENMGNNDSVRHHHLVNGTLNFDLLLDEFKAFMHEHGISLMRSAKTDQPLEISGQYLLLSYVSATMNSIQGYATIESVSSAGEMDLLAFYQGRRFIIETKIWHGRAKYEAGKVQLVEYLQAADLAKGYLVVFDDNLAKNPLCQENEEVFEVTVQDKTIRVYLISIN